MSTIELTWLGDTVWCLKQNEYSRSYGLTAHLCWLHGRQEIQKIQLAFSSFFSLPPLLFFLPTPFLPPFPSSIFLPLFPPSLPLSLFANFKVYINLSVVQQVIRFYLVILPVFLEISLDTPVMNFNPFSWWILCIIILKMISSSRERRHILCLGVVCEKAGKKSQCCRRFFKLLWIMFNWCPEKLNGTKTF